MKLIVGLGNPGPRYQNTRHNIGFMVLDELAGRWLVEKQDSRFDALIGHTRIQGQKILLVKPLTYMNLSGHAVQPLARYYRLEPENILIIYDDMDLAPGQLRLRERGSSGGHKGLKSVIERMGTQEISRLRIGIGRSGEREAVDWVLGSLAAGEDSARIAEAIKQAADAAETYVKQGIIAAMNAYNKNGSPTRSPLVDDQ